MPSHYGKERSEAAASRATAQRLVARASMALAAQKRMKVTRKTTPKPQRAALAGGVEEGAQELFQGLTANQRKKVGTEAPELRAHGVRKSK